jgi:hypothetical protein
LFPSNLVIVAWPWLRSPNNASDSEFPKIFSAHFRSPAFHAGSHSGAAVFLEHGHSRSDDLAGFRKCPLANRRMFGI